MTSSTSSYENMAFNHDFFWKLFEKLRRPVGFFLLLVLTSVLQHIFDMHFVCSCKPGLHPNGVLYIILPPLILTLGVNNVKLFYKKKFFLTEDCCCNRSFLFTFGRTVIAYISVTALWTAMVLFDGDWYFCLETNFNPKQTGMPCKTNLTYEEERIRDSYKTDSLDFGLGVSCSFLLLWTITAYFVPNFRSKCCCCTLPHYKKKYEKILSEEISSYIKNNLKEIAKRKAEEMCKSKIDVIKNHELSQNNVSEIEVSQTWENISDPGFLVNYQRQVTSPASSTSSFHSCGSVLADTSRQSGTEPLD